MSIIMTKNAVFFDDQADQKILTVRNKKPLLTRSGQSAGGLAQSKTWRPLTGTPRKAGGIRNALFHREIQAFCDLTIFS
jgi:hypothetical protein